MMKAGVNVSSAATKCAVMSCRHYRHTLLQSCISRQNLQTSVSKFESRVQPTTSRSLSLKLKYAGLVLYTKCTDGINYEEFIKYCHLPDTFFSWFLITELHVWMCMVRLKQNGDEGQIVRNSLISALWKDTKERAKLLGVVAMGQQNKEIDQLHQQFLAAIFTYDEGLLRDDKTLASALWTQLLQRECEKPEVLEGLVHYIRKQTLHMEGNSKENIVLKGHVTWVPLPNTNMHDQL